MLHAERPKQKVISVAGRLGEQNLATTPGKLMAASSVHTAGSDAEAVPSSQAEPELSTMLAEIAPYITFNSQINMYSTEPDLRRMVVQSVCQSIREVKIAFFSFVSFFNFFFYFYTHLYILSFSFF